MIKFSIVTGDGCLEKPLATLWRNYSQSSRPDVHMQLTVCGGGLKATTKDHGLTEYWSNRLTTCWAPPQFPRLFCWVYRHEGRKLRHELRCHAVLCSTTSVARQIEDHLKHCLTLALAEFKKDKISRQNARLSLVNSVYENPTIPRRKILLSVGSQNYKPPLERSKSAPKLTIIEENLEEEEEIFEGRPRNRLLRHSDSTGVLLERSSCWKNRIKYNSRYASSHTINTVLEKVDDSEERDEETNDGREKTKDNTFKHPEGEEGDDGSLLDETSALILSQLARDSMKNDLIESCESSWFTKLPKTPDLIPDGDEGSLSSGCESVGTSTSEESEKSSASSANDSGFKVGGQVRLMLTSRTLNLDCKSSFGLMRDDQMSRVVSLDCVGGKAALGLLCDDEVSLVPVGETQSDFSSLKVFKRRNSEDAGGRTVFEGDREGCEVEEDARSDESGYDEALDSISTVSNVIMV